MNLEPIQKYILKNKRNLNIASAVAEAWPEAREKVVAGFLERLATHLKRRLKGYKAEVFGGRFYIDQYPGFYVDKPAWRHYSVGFQCGDYGNHMVIGVARDTDDTKKLPLHEPILTAVQGILPAAKSTSWWEARVNMPAPEADWRTPQALWRMHRDHTFLTDVADQLEEVVEVSAGIIDKLAGKQKN